MVKDRVSLQNLPSWVRYLDTVLRPVGEVWLSRLPVTEETTGSSPVRVALEVWLSGLKRSPAKGELGETSTEGSNPSTSASRGEMLELKQIAQGIVEVLMEGYPSVEMSPDTLRVMDHTGEVKKEYPVIDITTTDGDEISLLVSKR